MASAPSDDLFDQFLADRGHETEPQRWDRSYNKKQCPDCGALHDDDAITCTVCGWDPYA
ncbi:HVO_0416 family zinc finger protein [Haloprofundus salilacus]|uniref:HVO_0416 family zinc finger protein n=1 Tax=Haloprofundus salilacus TaxID=2876190 RepID=UPI001CCBB0DB|nr:HVO_0416 family zinc finger protein [Haloprofundus salilacus]